MNVTVGTYPWTVGAVIAFLVAVFAVLGLIGVVPFTPVVVFACIGGLALARLI